MFWALGTQRKKAQSCVEGDWAVGMGCCGDHEQNTRGATHSPDVSIQKAASRTQCGSVSLYAGQLQHLAETELAPLYHLWASLPMPEPRLGSSCLARDPWGLGRHL